MAIGDAGGMGFGERVQHGSMMAISLNRGFVGRFGVNVHALEVVEFEAV